MKICCCFIRLLLFWICCVFLSLLLFVVCCSTEFSLEPIFCFYLCVLGTRYANGIQSHIVGNIVFAGKMRTANTAQRWIVCLFLFIFFSIRLTPIFFLLLFLFYLSDQHIGANNFSHSVHRSRRKLSTMEEIKRSLPLNMQTHSQICLCSKRNSFFSVFLFTFLRNDRIPFHRLCALLCIENSKIR